MVPHRRAIIPAEPQPLASIRALLAEQDAALRTSLEGYLHDFGMDVRAVTDHRALSTELTASTFDVLLIDADLAGASAWDFSRSLRARSEVPLIMLIDDNALAARVGALDGGADDCLVKPFDRRELVARIGAVIRRSGGRRRSIGDALGDAHVRFNGWLLDAGRRLLVAPNGVPVALSAHECQLMTAFVAKVGDVISRRRLLTIAKAGGSASTERGIESSVARLRRKLGADATLIRTVRGEGFVFRGRVEAFES